MYLSVKKQLTCLITLGIIAKIRNIPRSFEDIQEDLFYYDSSGESPAFFG